MAEVNSPEEPTAHTFVQLVAEFAVLIYLCRVGIGLRRRARRSWDSLLARLQMDWTARELSDLGSVSEKRKFDFSQTWKRIRSAHGLWAMYQNAGVMLEMADYAARNSDSVGTDVLVGLRSNALLIRIYILQIIVRCIRGATQENICIKALQLESLFIEMELQTQEILQRAVPVAAAEFSAAM